MINVNFLKGDFFLFLFWKINFGNTIQMNNPIITFTTIDVIFLLKKKEELPFIDNSPNCNITY